MELVPSLVVHMPEIDGETAAFTVDELEVDRHRRSGRIAPEDVVAKHPTAYGVEIVGDRNRRWRTHEHSRLILAAERTVPEPRHPIAEKKPCGGPGEGGLGVDARNPPPLPGRHGA